VINTNLHPISHRFRVIADYWSNFRFRPEEGCTQYTLVQGERRVRTTKFGVRKLETSLYPVYRMVLTYLQIII